MIRRICAVRVLLTHSLLQTPIPAYTIENRPLKDISELKRVKFVMKGGDVVKNELPK